MKTSEYIHCIELPCQDVDKTKIIFPYAEINPAHIQMIMISEAAPSSPSDYYYAGNESLFERTTLQAFKDAGIQAESFDELLEKGVYFTTAIKCGKMGYTVKSSVIKNCSYHLEKELALFPNVKVIMLMGDFAIKSINYITQRQIGKKVIPNGSTYKIRVNKYFFGDIRLFPSYLQAGPAYFLEQSKRRIIKDDLMEAIKLLDQARVL